MSTNVRGGHLMWARMSGVVIWCEHECPGWSFDVSTNVRPCQKSHGNECPWERMSGIRLDDQLYNSKQSIGVTNDLAYNIVLIKEATKRVNDCLGPWGKIVLIVNLMRKSNVRPYKIYGVSMTGNNCMYT